MVQHGADQTNKIWMGVGLDRAQFFGQKLNELGGVIILLRSCLTILQMDRAWPDS